MPAAVIDVGFEIGAVGLAGIDTAVADSAAFAGHPCRMAHQLVHGAGRLCLRKIPHALKSVDGLFVESQHLSGDGQRLHLFFLLLSTASRFLYRKVICIYNYILIFEFHLMPSIFCIATFFDKIVKTLLIRGAFAGATRRTCREPMF